MDYKRIVSSFLLLFCLLQLQAQKIDLSGLILDRETQEKVAYADVVAYLVGDTARNVADVGLTDDNGKYSLALEKGTYNIEVEYLGYKKSTLKVVVTGETAKQTVRTIRLRPDVEQLEGAVVVGKAVAVQTKEDTVEFNANTVKLPEGSAIEALIKKLPGAQISSDGKITVNGKEIKKILVDGKEFFSDDPQVVLKNLPANLVDKVKSYDKKSDEARLTGMDDNDDEAVLDLSVKKGMKHGWLGNVNAGLGGSPLHYDASANLNRFDDDQNMSVIAQGNDINNAGGKGGAGSNGLSTNAGAAITYAKEKEKMKLGGSARYNFTENDIRKKSSTEYFNQNGNTFGRDTSLENKQQHNFNMDYQMEWKPNKLSTFQFRPSFKYSKSYNTSERSNYSFNHKHMQNNQSTSTGDGENESVNTGATLRYVQQFNAKKGRNLSVSARLNYADNDKESNDKSRTFFTFYDDDDSTATGDSTFLLNRHTNSNNNSFSYNLQAAYTEPISTHHLMQVRYVFQQRESDNNTYIYNNVGADRIMDSLLSSKVDNSYIAHEAELNLQGKFTKVKYKLGFNVSPQTSHSVTHLGPNDGRNLKNTPVNYAPNLMFRYSFNKKHTLMLRYRGQSSAPSVENMQEVIDQSDPSNIMLGNPDLKPSFNNNLRLRYSNYLSNTQSNLSFNASFGNTLNAVTNSVSYDEATGYRTSRKENINGNWNASAFATYFTPFGNSPFSASASTQGQLSEDVGYSSSKKQPTPLKSTTQNKSLSQRLNISFSKNDYEVGLNGAITYVDSKNDMNNKVNRQTYDYTVGANANVVLPLGINLGTDITGLFFDGYDDDLTENCVNWNAELSRSFLKNKAANVRVRYVDILQQQKNLKRTSTANQITDTRYNTLGSYFMVYFSYKFNSFGTSAEGGDTPGGMNFAPGGPTGPGGFGGGPKGGGFGGPRGEGGYRGGPDGGPAQWGGQNRRPAFENDSTAGNAPREGGRRKRAKEEYRTEMEAHGVSAGNASAEDNAPKQAAPGTSQGQPGAATEQKQQ